MGNEENKRKKKRPVSRGFWWMLNYLPKFLRENFIRRQFDLNYDLPEEILLKQAETEDEIFQALNLVYNSYIELSYIDKNETMLRFNKYLAHPNSIILIAKRKDEVIGTISIISDSAMGLPSDSVWPINKYRQSGKAIAEVSSLAIKKDFKLRRGKLLFPLCKIMYLYASEILNLDGLIISTTIEVEPFYTDILLFEKVVAETGQKNPFAKGNPSTCCYLDLSNVAEKYKKVYGHKKPSQNVHQYFVGERTKNFILPEKKISIQSYTQFKNAAQAKILAKHPNLLKDFTQKEFDIINANKQYIQNPELLHTNVSALKRKRSPRADVRCDGWLFPHENSQPLKCKIMDISRTGLRILFPANDFTLKSGSLVSVIAHTSRDTVFFKVEIRWINDSSSVGASIKEASQNFQSLIDEIEDEALAAEDSGNHKRIKTPA